MTTNKGNGWVLDTENLTLSVANLFPELDAPSSDVILSVSTSGTEVIMLPTNPSKLTTLNPFGIDGGQLITSNISAVAHEAGVLGETINVSLIGGITSASDLPSTHYLKKNDLFFPYTVYVDGEATAAAETSIIKSVQRGYAYINTNTVTITFDAVDLAKSSFSAFGGTNYNNAIGAPAYIQPISSTQFYLKTNSTTANGYCYWEVVEYV